MAIWIAKAVVQKTLSFLPAGQRINYFFQKHVTRGVRLTDDWFEDKLAHCRDHVEAWRKYGTGRAGFRVAELGTGWYPVVPAGLYLCGAGPVVTYDLNALLRDDNTAAMLEKFRAYIRSGRLQALLPLARPERMDALMQLAGHRASELLAKLNTRPVVGDARHTGLPAGSVDLIVSNNVFEHIDPRVLKGILAEFTRIASRGGVMSHFIDMSDHFAHLDGSISIYNFLKFSDGAWKLIDSSIQPLNRLRIYDYRTLYREVGTPITEERNRPGSLDDLRALKLSPRFRQQPVEQTAISHSLLISVMT